MFLKSIPLCLEHPAGAQGRVAWRCMEQSSDKKESHTPHLHGHRSMIIHIKVLYLLTISGARGRGAWHRMEQRRPLPGHRLRGHVPAHLRRVGPGQQRAAVQARQDSQDPARGGVGGRPRDPHDGHERWEGVEICGLMTSADV